LCGKKQVTGVLNVTCIKCVGRLSTNITPIRSRHIRNRSIWFLFLMQLWMAANKL